MCPIFNCLPSTPSLSLLVEELKRGHSQLVVSILIIIKIVNDTMDIVLIFQDDEGLGVIVIVAYISAISLNFFINRRQCSSDSV